MDKEWLFQQFPDCPPLLERLRVSRERQRVCFQSLDGGKRLPENERDWEGLQLRHQQAATSVLGGPGAPCLLLQGVRLEFDFGLPLEHVSELDSGDWKFGARECSWDFQEFFSILREVAHDRLHNVCWMSRRNGSIYAPSAGGMDFFVQKPAGLAARWPYWLSAEDKAIWAERKKQAVQPVKARPAPRPAVVVERPPFQAPAGLSQIEIDWLVQLFAGCPPMGYLLRDEFEPRWVRFHSLPESKRYAGTDEEWRILLERHEAMAATVLGEGQPCFFLQARHYSQAGQLIEYELGAERVGDLDSPVTDEIAFVPGWWTFGVRKTTWKRGHYEQILRNVANDRIAYVLWISAESGDIYAPYDGGADLFVRNPSELKERWADWLPRNEAGL